MQKLYMRFLFFPGIQFLKQVQNDLGGNENPNWAKLEIDVPLTLLYR